MPVQPAVPVRDGDLHSEGPGAGRGQPRSLGEVLAPSGGQGEPAAAGPHPLRCARRGRRRGSGPRTRRCRGCPDPYGGDRGRDHLGSRSFPTLNSTTRTLHTNHYPKDLIVLSHDLRIGVIGFGARHSLAVHAHQPGEGSVVTVVADPGEHGKAQGRKAVGEDSPIGHSADELLAEHEVDAVMNLAPDYPHAAVALKTLEGGIPTFSEKPMA